MTQEIKQRIEQIRRGEVPEGYARTELGIIPKEWTELLIGDVIEFYQEKSIKNNEYPVLTSSRSGLSLQAEYFEDQVTREENAGYNVIPYGYCTFRSRSDDGHFTFNQNTIIDKGIVSCFYPVFRIKKQVAVDKVVLCFLNSFLGKQIIKEIVGTSQLVLSEKKLSSLRIIIPPVVEQKRIAEMLTTCDRVIELKQKLIDELKKLKKVCLTKMFPQEGETLPEIRFHGFAAPWERCKLSTIADIVTGTTPPTKDIDNYGGDKLFISPADIQEDRYVVNTTTTLTEKGYILGRKLRGGTSLFVSIGSSIGKVAQIKDFATTNQQINAVVPHDVMADDFVFTMLENEADSIKKLTTMQAVPIINKTTFGDIEIKHPQKNEQRKIGELFSILDNLITFHQRELKEKQRKKKALMQLLLTGIVRVK